AKPIALQSKICYNFYGLIWDLAYLNYTRRRGLSGSLFSFVHKKIGILSDADNGTILLQPRLVVVRIKDKMLKQLTVIIKV
ncbi:MAG: hypothetical protein IJ657_07585, partial [Acidaminococcaceae bacterium]|nr:hypothetical protein [Acidaminococcaceae bacterium]